MAAVVAIPDRWVLLSTISAGRDRFGADELAAERLAAALVDGLLAAGVIEVFGVADPDGIEVIFEADRPFG